MAQKDGRGVGVEKTALWRRKKGVNSSVRKLPQARQNDGGGIIRCCLGKAVPVGQNSGCGDFLRRRAKGHKNECKAVWGKACRARQNSSCVNFMGKKRHLAEKKRAILIGRKLRWARKKGG
ncbi:hypothetical protein T11_17107 [Trichinella zimbabwensis]|uniref:Uncharacterized protein n=1 Tax=Trichinella zimbabwensis TaxID=268475 RepID=A0A0V1GPV7_9BILA|nr:hypothetical protein T11_17107 [Trichinella zimbabwensis]